MGKLDISILVISETVSIHKSISLSIDQMILLVYN